VVPHSSARLTTFKYTDPELQFFPHFKALKWIQNNTGNDERVLSFFRWNCWFHNERKIFNRGKFHIIDLDNESNLLHSGDFNAFRQNLEELIKKEKISYIMFSGTIISGTNLLSENREMELKKLFKGDKYDDFILAAQFNIRHNYIYIYKSRNNFINKQ
jgi:hypothetical protein